MEAQVLVRVRVLGSVSPVKILSKRRLYLLEVRVAFIHTLPSSSLINFDLGVLSPQPSNHIQFGDREGID